MFCDKVYIVDEYTQLVYVESDTDWEPIHGLVIQPSAAICFDGLNLWIAHDIDLIKYSLLLGRETQRISLRKPRLYGLLYIYMNVLHITDNLYKGYKELDIEAIDLKTCESTKPVVFEDGYKIDDVVCASSQIIFCGASSYTVVGADGMRYVYDGKLYRSRYENNNLVITKTDDQEIEHLF